MLLKSQPATMLLLYMGDQEAPVLARDGRSGEHHTEGRMHAMMHCSEAPSHEGVPATLTLLCR